MASSCRRLPRSALTKRRRLNLLTPCDEDLEAEMYERTIGVLTAAGLPAWYAQQIVAAEEVKAAADARPVAANDKMVMGAIGIGSPKSRGRAIYGEAKKQKGVEKREAYACRQGGAVTEDPHYTVRAWRAVVTYLLRRCEFLYE